MAKCTLPCLIFGSMLEESFPCEDEKPRAQSEQIFSESAVLERNEDK